MDLTKEQIEGLLTSFAHMRMRPQMYFSNDLPTVQNWLYGFEAACRLFDIRVLDDVWKIWHERGWSNGAMSGVPQMVKKGLSEDEIILEVFTILIIAVQRKYQIGDEALAKFHREMRQHAQKALQEIENPTTEINFYRNETMTRSAREQVERTLKKLDAIENEIDRSGS